LAAEMGIIVVCFVGCRQEKDGAMRNSDNTINKKALRFVESFFMFLSY
jgi:hypothetical protein